MRFLFFLTVLAAQSTAAEYANPVLPGDFPDPSLIRAGNEYWATATSSGWAPIFPLLRSRDLVNWTLEGAVFERRPDWSENRYWAPEIAQHGNRFYIYYTAGKKNGPLCVAVATAPKPAGPWTDHGPMVCQEVGSIDAVPVTDENGQRWLVWKEDGNSRRRPTPLWAQRLNEDGTKLTGEMHELMRNDAPWEGQLVEGPFILRRGAWFYMFYSGAGCCGVKCNYALGVARSKKLLGPWEKNPANPILAENADWRCPGHGSIVETPDGRTFLLYHAYDPRESIYVGRQGLLDEVTWGSDGWPSINGGKGPSAKGTVPGSAVQKRPEQLTTGFWQWPPSIQARLHKSGAWQELTGLVAAQSPIDADYTASLVLDLESVTGTERGGLAAWGNRENALGLSAGAGSVWLWVREKGMEKGITNAALPPGSKRVHLRMTARGGRRFTFAWSPDGRTWTPVSQPVDGEHLPPWDLATRVAVTCTGDQNCSVRFRDFRVTQ